MDEQTEAALTKVAWIIYEAENLRARLHYDRKRAREESGWAL